MCSGVAGMAEQHTPQLEPSSVTLLVRYRCGTIGVRGVICHLRGVMAPRGGGQDCFPSQVWVVFKLILYMSEGGPWERFSGLDGSGGVEMKSYTYTEVWQVVGGAV